MATVATPRPTENPNATTSETTRSAPGVLSGVDRPAVIATDSAAGDRRPVNAVLPISGRPAHALAREQAKTGTWRHVDPKEAPHARRHPL